MILTRLKKLARWIQLARQLEQHPRLHNLIRQAIESEQETDADARYNLQFNTLDRLSSYWGFEIYNHHASWADDQEFRDLWKDFPLAGQRRDRKFALWSIANSIRGLPGDTAECGVLYGHSTHLICSALETESDRQHHAFDSFEGLSQPQQNDSPQSTAAYAWEQGSLAVDLTTVRENLRQFRNIHYHKGWIPDRFSDVEGRQFALVHVDVDLYQPTLDATKFFAARLVPGGIIVCDDYGFETCPGARQAFDMVSVDTGMPVIHLPTGQGIMIRH